MTHHENEGIIDKIKHALGMGNDHDDAEEHDHAEHDHAEHDHGAASAVDPALTSHDAPEGANRPAGPDFGADDASRGSIADPATVDTDRRDP